MSRRETAMVWIAAACIVAGWVWLTAAQGAVGIARNDDWSYLRNAFALADTGQLQVTGWVQMTLIGQLLLAWPVIEVFGASVTALQLLVACFGVILIATSYALARLIAPAWIAVIAAGTVALGPLLGTLSVSFMTDVPAAALQLVTLWLGIRGLQRRRPWWLLVAAGTGLLAFSIREYAVVAIASVWVIAVIGVRARGARLSRGFLLLWTLGIVAIGLAIVGWRSSQVTTTVNPLALNAQGLFFASALPLTIGLLCLPAAACINPLRALGRAWTTSRVLVVIAGLGLAGTWYVSRLRPLGNYATIEGAYTQVIRGIPTPLVPEWLWLLTTILAMIATIALLAVTVTALANAAIWHWPDRSVLASRAALAPEVPVLVVFLLLTLALFLILPTVAQTALFDRYLLAGSPIAAALALRSARLHGVLWRASWWPIPIAQFIVFIVASVTIVGGTAALDGARWAIARDLVARTGIAEGNVDGGFDWFGFHPEGAPMPNPVWPHWTWWTTNPSDRAVCATITFADPGIDPQAAGPDATTPILAERIVHSPLGEERILRVFRGPDDCAEVGQ